MLFQSNIIRVFNEDLPGLLANDQHTQQPISYAYYYVPRSELHGVPRITFDVKACIRRVVVLIDVIKGWNGFSDRIGLLLKCPELQEVDVFIWKNPELLIDITGHISDAFKPLAEKTGCRLTFRVNNNLSRSSDPEKLWGKARFYDNLKELEDAALDQKSSF